VIVVAVMFYWNAKLALLALVPLPLLIVGALAYYANGATGDNRLQRRAASNIQRAVARQSLPGFVRSKVFAREQARNTRVSIAPAINCDTPR